VAYYHYTDDEVSAAGIDEESLRMYYWDRSENVWRGCIESGVDVENNFVYADVYHLTTFAPMTADTTPPEPFDLISPEDSATLTTFTPTLEWQASSDPESAIDHYEIWIDGEKVDNVAGTEYTTPELSAGSHEWYVVAVNGMGLKTHSTSTYTFNIEASP